jgi:molybdenum cofactor biosynthesis enzyme MoaA
VRLAPAVILRCARLRASKDGTRYGCILRDAAQRRGSSG